jgi:mRNA-degrading endonuclease toxin of MazEF toxin-antitoxin module
VDLKNLILEPRFVKYVGDAFSPLGVMVDDATPKVAGGPRDYPIVITNDLYQDQTGTLQVAVTDAQEQQTLWRTGLPFRVAALGQSVVKVSVSLPTQPGPYRVVARLTAADGRSVASRRKIVVVTPEEARRMVNVARGCPTTASSEVTDSRGDCPARFATDGKLGTRWSSEFADPQWIMVDLRQVRRISRVSLAWETAFGKAYRIQVSTDGQDWRDVYSTDQGRGGREDISFAPADARYVRLYGTARGTQCGYSLWEFEVFEE